ncbi:MAG: DNA polymerase III subunit delta [Nitrospirota bacterium]|nr:DNA polymerase III subunit delta [Nitrospirota bacterium]
MTFKEALKHLEHAAPFSPLYLITGDEPFLIETLLGQFSEKGLEPGAQSFNFSRIQGSNTSAEAILAIANTFPIASPRRMIWIHNAEQIKDERGLFLDYFANPSETTLLVFIAEKPDMRKKLFSTLKKKAMVIHCPRPKDGEVPTWIRHAAKKNGLDLSEELIWFLKEHLGRDLLAIHQEIAKLALFCATTDESEKKAVSIDVAQKIIGNGRSHTIFELTDAVGNKNSEKALVLLGKLLSEGAHPLFILTMLVRLWRQMSIAKTLIDTGQAQTVAKRVPMPPSLLQRFLRQLKHWTQDEIQKAFEQALSVDSQLKGGNLPARTVLETLLLDLCRPEISEKRQDYSLSFF